MEKCFSLPREKLKVKLNSWNLKMWPFREAGKLEPYDSKDGTANARNKASPALPDPTWATYEQPAAGWGDRWDTCPSPAFLLGPLLPAAGESRHSPAVSFLSFRVVWNLITSDNAFLAESERVLIEWKPAAALTEHGRHNRKYLGSQTHQPAGKHRTAMPRSKASGTGQLLLSGKVHS